MPEMTKSDNLPFSPVEAKAASPLERLDLPGILTLLLIVASWEFLLKRIVGLARMQVNNQSLRELLLKINWAGSFAENFVFLLAIAVLGITVIMLSRQQSFSPIPHRITLIGFAFSLIAISLLWAIVPVSPDTALLAHVTTVLYSALIIFTLLWHRLDRLFVAGCILFLIPILLRFYSACAISITEMRTEYSYPLYIYRIAEITALVAAVMSPWLIARLSIKKFLAQPPIAAISIAFMPALAFAAALISHQSEIREICLYSLGFELFMGPVYIVYPIALFMLVFTICILILPRFGEPQPLSKQRIGYALALLLIAGLDGLHGSVIFLGAESRHLPELIRFLLEGHWEQLNTTHRALIGPPLRSQYQLVLVALSYTLMVRAAFSVSQENRVDENLTEAEAEE